ncbi:MAG: hypothetical protein JST31_00035 [Actinobacteria bacterium]|nr:hypothetical protein [Actinomycetota bacterium]
MADAGAARIKALIETPSTTLGRAANRLGAGLRAATSDEEAASPATIAALERMRDFYSGLSRQIEEIETRTTVPQDEALAALTRLDAGLGNFLQALHETNGETAEKELRNAKRRIARGGADLARAGERIR